MIKKIRKRDGRLVDFNKKKIVYAVTLAAESVEEKVDAEKVAEIVEKKLLHNQEFESGEKIPTVEDIQDIVEEALMKDYPKIAKAYILYRHRKAEERTIKNALIGKSFKTDMNIATLKLLRDRYLRFNAEEGVFETPEEMFDRVAEFVAKAELNYSKDEADVARYKKLFKNMMKNLDFLPNSPALINAGREGYKLSSSVALPIEDSVDSIYNTLHLAAMLQQAGAGTGFSFSNLRPKGAFVKGVSGVAQGPTNFIKLFDYSSNLVLQSGKRKGANIGILRVDHPDILDFITLKSKKGGVTNFNLSVALTDEFIEAVILDKDYALKDHETGEVKEILNAKQVFDIIVATAWENGEPGVLFLDRINKTISVNKGKIHTTSPCAEFLLEDYECGYVGAINLSNFVVEGKIDFGNLRKTIITAVRFLDNLIDVDTFITTKSENITKKNRKIGLGVMGLAQMLILLRIAYNSEEAIDVVEKVMSFIKKEADNASEELAKERGNFPNWEKSDYAKEGRKMRNATRTAVSPTGSISMIAETSPGIEPLFALSYIKKFTGGEVRIVDYAVKKVLAEENIYSLELIEKIANLGIDSVDEIPDNLKKVFVTTHDISPFNHVRMQACVQKYVDNAVSKTVNLPEKATLMDVENVFLLAYKLGCKGCTVYREGSREGAISTTAFLKRSPEVTSKHPVREELKVLMQNKSLADY